MRGVRRNTIGKRTRGVCYYNHGTKHLARLLVSLRSLRRHHTGPVQILDTGESGGIVQRIATRLEADVTTIPHEALRRHSCYVAKAGLWRHSPFWTTLLLDADTLVAGSIEPLFNLLEGPESGNILVTRFSNWITTGDIMRGRIERWRGIWCPSVSRESLKSIKADELVEASLAEPHGAINTGVVGWCHEATGILRDWERLTRTGWKLPITDELALQLLLRRYRHTMVDDRYNCSPIYGQNRQRAVIWHQHGSKHVERADGRGREGHAIWWPEFCAAWRSNLAGLRSWAPAGDDALTHALATYSTALPS